MAKLQKLSKILLKVVEYGLLGILFTLFFLILSPRLPTKNIFTAFIVPTGSMEPFVQTGSIALVNTKNPSNLQAGDVIAFKSPIDDTKTILHRIVSINSDQIITKGDSNKSEDNWVVPKGNVKGTLITSIPYVGHIASFIRTKLGFFLLVFTPGAFLLASYLTNIYEGFREEFRDKKKRLIPILPLIFGILALGTVVLTKTAFAQWTSTASVTGISLVAAVTTPTPTPSPTPSATPKPTRSPRPTPTNPPSCPGGIDIQYDIEARLLIISITVNDNEIILLSLPFWRSANVNYKLTYDTENLPQAVLGSTHINRFGVFNKKLFMGSCSNGTCVKHIVIGCPKLEINID